MSENRPKKVRKFDDVTIPKCLRKRPNFKNLEIFLTFFGQTQFIIRHFCSLLEVIFEFNPENYHRMNIKNSVKLVVSPFFESEIQSTVAKYPSAYV